MRTDALFVAHRLESIRRRVLEIQAAAPNAKTAAVRIVAVTKYLDAGQMRELRRAGLDCFGESRVQDALPKLSALTGSEAPREWHFIGTLQGNKVKAVVGRFQLIHSVDRLELAEAMSQCAQDAGIQQAVLLQVNVSGEGSKHGFTPETLPLAWPRLSALPGLRVCGLMGMAALEGPARPAFRLLRELRDHLDAGGQQLPELSMGMSGDYEDAVAEGATLVRIGTSLFSEEAET